MIGPCEVHSACHQPSIIARPRFPLHPIGAIAHKRPSFHCAHKLIFQNGIKGQDLYRYFPLQKLRAARSNPVETENHSPGRLLQRGMHLVGTASYGCPPLPCLESMPGQRTIEIAPGDTGL